MKPFNFLKQRNRAFIRLSFNFALLLSSIAVIAQTPVNFSGKWMLDNNKSTFGKMDTKYDGTITRNITQTPATLTCTDLYTKPGNQDFETAPESYNLDGKEVVEKHSVETTKTVAKWSQDKKILTISITSIATIQGKQEEYIYSFTYRLSPDGKTLYIENYAKNSVIGEEKTTKVYNKK